VARLGGAACGGSFGKGAAKRRREREKKTRTIRPIRPEKRRYTWEQGKKRGPEALLRSRKKRGGRTMRTKNRGRKSGLKVLGGATNWESCQEKQKGRREKRKVGFMGDCINGRRRKGE